MLFLTIVNETAFFPVTVHGNNEEVWEYPYAWECDWESDPSAILVRDAFAIRGWICGYVDYHRGHFTIDGEPVAYRVTPGLEESIEAIEDFCNAETVVLEHLDENRLEDFEE